jgi:hypothetical protein
MGVHDSGYRQLFASTAMVEDLLHGFVREKWVDELDFSATCCSRRCVWMTRSLFA